MLQKKINFENKIIKEKLKLNPTRHKSTWKHYSECYNYTLLKLLEQGLKSNNYVFNPCARGILFLLRHGLELTIKNDLNSKGIEIPNSHIFSDLILAYDKLNHIPEAFKEILNKVDKDSDGSLYRYYERKPHKKEKTNEPFFEWKENDDCRINLSEIIKSYNRIPRNNKFKLGNICEEFNYDDKMIVWNLTLHMLESKNLSHIRNEYDEVIGILLEGIINQNFDIDKVYLPLLFLVRHSLELGLKYNLQEAKKISPDKVSDNDFNEIHSLAKLYNEFGGKKGFLAKLDLTEMPIKTKKQFSDFQKKYEKLNELIHQLDRNSYYFRFPFDIKGKEHILKMKRNNLYEILDLLFFTDAFITFSLLVLKDNNIICD